MRQNSGRPYGSHRVRSSEISVKPEGDGVVRKPRTNPTERKNPEFCESFAWSSPARHTVEIKYEVISSANLRGLRVALKVNFCNWFLRWSVHVPIQSMSLVPESSETQMTIGFIVNVLPDNLGVWAMAPAVSCP